MLRLSGSCMFGQIRWSGIVIAAAAMGLAMLASSCGSPADRPTSAANTSPNSVAANAIEPETPAFDCPVTAPNGATPPGESYSRGHHGNGAIWTGLWPDGKVVFKPGGPGAIQPDGTLEMKWWWWRSVPGELRIEGKRLDGPPGGILRAEIPAGYGKTGFQVSGLIFPSAGCWEVTAHVGDQSLAFVTAVVLRP